VLQKPAVNPHRERNASSCSDSTSETPGTKLAVDYFAVTGGAWADKRANMQPIYKVPRVDPMAEKPSHRCRRPTIICCLRDATGYKGRERSLQMVLNYEIDFNRAQLVFPGGKVDKGDNAIIRILLS